jgi:ribonuclease P protein component
LEQARRYTLKKDERLKSRKAIELLFRSGSSFSVFPLRVYWLFMERPGTVLQSGFGVSTKNFKTAVGRNRVKRLMRETYRLQKIPLYEKLKDSNRQLAVFIIYSGNELPEYPLLFTKTGAVLKRLIKITDENRLAGT